jgi:hypothetical protein
MRFRLWVLFLSISLIASIAFAQPDPNEQGLGFRFHDGGAGGMMQSIFIPPRANAPFSLTLDTEWSKPLGTGGSITVTNVRRIARDSSGRIFQERRFLVPKGSGQEPQLRIFQISDPAQHIWYSCDPRTKICEVYSYRLTTTQNYAPALARSAPLPHGDGVRNSEDLGVGNTAGMETHGYREATTYNPGVVGNDREMIATREFWYAPQLAIDLLSIVDEPMSGKQVFTARDVSTSEPDPALFAVPADYKVVDRRAEQQPE